MRLLAFLAVTTATFAQAVLAPYEPTQQLKLKGPVTRIEWVNPRAYVFVNSTDSTGTTTSWAIDIGNPLELERSGWKSDTLHTGDIVTVDANPARAQQLRALAKSITNASGAKLFTALETPTGEGRSATRADLARTAMSASAPRPARKATGASPAQPSLQKTKSPWTATAS